MVPKIIKGLIIGLVVRCSVILYGEYHDTVAEVPFTDVDYKVFTDAARHMVNEETPYKRQTYRYTPLVAFILMPNIFLNIAWGKFLFSAIDLLSGFLMYMLMKNENLSEVTAFKCSMFWILNPLSVVISARGNCDSIVAFTILLVLLALKSNRSTLAGLLLALAIHIRLYPIVFSLACYLSLKDSKSKLSRPISHRNGLTKFIFYKLVSLFYQLIPNRKQTCFILSLISNLMTFTILCHLLYGDDYLNESILYHLKRKDTRHNFSVYFYLQYLSPNQSSFLMFLPQLILLIVFSFVFGSKKDLNFCLLLQSIIIVTYNPVLTSQYFIWFISLLPPVMPFLKLTIRQSAALSALWFAAQLAWLLPAYWLEFRGRNTFLYIWLQGIAFFCANLAVLVRFIRAYENNSHVTCEIINQKTIKPKSD